MKKGKWDSSSDEESEKKGSPPKRHKLSAKVSIHSSVSKSMTDDSNISIPIHSASICKSTVIPPTIAASVSSSSSSSNLLPKRVFNPIFDGCRSIDSYDMIKFIDEGTYGMVFKARDRDTNDIYAIKQIKFMPGDSNKVGFPTTALREINILLALQHPNIVRVKEMVIGSTIDKIYMVMDYCENDLKTCMNLAQRSFSTGEVKQLLLQLLSGVEHMHKNWYIHRDLKTSNLLYSNKGVLSICDFGLARKYGSPVAPYTNCVVTLWYRAPELLLGAQTYSTALDMWSVGCIFAELLGGSPLFPGQGEADQINKIFRTMGVPTEENWPEFTSLPNVPQLSLRGPSKSKLREQYPLVSFAGNTVPLSDVGFDLLSATLIMDPKQRISAASALQHEWLVLQAPRPTSVNDMPRFEARTKDDDDDEIAVGGDGGGGSNPRNPFSWN